MALEVENYDVSKGGDSIKKGSKFHDVGESGAPGTRSRNRT